MLKAAFLFFVLALASLLVGATGFAGLPMELGRTLVIAFLILASISFVAGMISEGGTPDPLSSRLKLRNPPRKTHNNSNSALL